MTIETAQKPRKTAPVWEKRRRRRNWAIAGLAGLAATISVLSPAGAASAHSEEKLGAIASTTTTTIATSSTSTVDQFASTKTTFDDGEQFLAWDQARTAPARIPALQTPPTTPDRPGRLASADGKQIAAGPSTTVTPGEFAIADGGNDNGDLVGPGGVVATPGPVGSFNDCHIDFNEKSVLQILPNHAHATFVEWPFWLEECAGGQGNITVRPMDVNHYHLGYEDLQISFCTDIGNFGRHTEPRPVNPTDEELLDWYNSPCNEIDPVAETRSDIQPHGPGYTTEIFAYESFGDKLPMTLNSIQIVSGQSEICYLGTGDWIASEPGQSPWQCLTLGAGHWNLSEIADDVIGVRVIALTNDNRIDNIAADIL